MQRRIHVGLLFGGRSREHEISVISARSVFREIDRQKYEVTLIGIDKTGQWHWVRDGAWIFSQEVVEAESLVPIILEPGQRRLLERFGTTYRPLDIPALDIILPLLHGPFGEDGRVQGLLDIADIPYVGSGVIGSAVGMDKAMMKRAFRAEGLPCVSYRVIQRHAWKARPNICSEKVNGHLHYPLFVKPANLGSSVGVVRVEGPNSLPEGIEQALQFDDQVLVEEAVNNCQEIECAVLGNDEPLASCLGEIRPGATFYSYEAKYLSETSECIIPAPLLAQTTETIRALSIRAFQAIEARGLARVDFFVDSADGSIYLNEINTLPGFTPISMYPKLWKQSGVTYSALIDRLIELGFEHFNAFCHR